MNPPSALRIMPLGDSITQGSPDFPGGYRGPLAAYLLAAGHCVDFVGSRTDNSDGLADPEHEGHPGFRIDQLRVGDKTPYSEAAPIGDSLRNNRPDVILLLAGTNNLYFDAPERAAGEMRQLLEEIFVTKSDAIVFLGTLTPILPGPKNWGIVIAPDVKERVEQYNDLLGALAEEFRAKSSRIHLTLMDGCCNGPADYLEDGVHPSPDALRRVGARWFESFEKVFPPAA